MTHLFYRPKVEEDARSMFAIPRVRETEFEVFGRRITAKRWGQEGAQPFFALHGWLDNANTFDRLMHYLPELDVIALDFAGHGYSDHRGPGIHYDSLSDIQDVLAVAAQLEWTQFGLIGHSMGASIASELAAMYPQTVTSAVMIDGFVATGGVTVPERIDQAREALDRMLNFGDKAARTYPDVDTMASRVTEATDQTLAAASVLVARGHKSVEGGVTWRTDPRIRFPSPYRHNRGYLDQLLTYATSPALLIVAEQGDRWYQGEIEDSGNAHQNLSIKHMPGPHHIHLEPRYVLQVAQFAREFLDLPPLHQDAVDQLEWDGTL